MQYAPWAQPTQLGDASPTSLGMPLASGLIRWFSCVPMHALWGAADAALLWMLSPRLLSAKSPFVRYGILILATLAMAVVHGLYDVACGRDIYAAVSLSIGSVFLVQWIVARSAAPSEFAPANSSGCERPFERFFCFRYAIAQTLAIGLAGFGALYFVSIPLSEQSEAAAPRSIAPRINVTPSRVEYDKLKSTVFIRSTHFHSDFDPGYPSWFHAYEVLLEDSAGHQFSVWYDLDYHYSVWDRYEINLDSRPNTKSLSELTNEWRSHVAAAITKFVEWSIIAKANSVGRVTREISGARLDAKLYQYSYTFYFHADTNENLYLLKLLLVSNSETQADIEMEFERELNEPHGWLFSVLYKDAHFLDYFYSHFADFKALGNQFLAQRKLAQEREKHDRDVRTPIENEEYRKKQEKAAKEELFK